MGSTPINGSYDVQYLQTKILAKADKDGNGSVTKDELTAFQERLTADRRTARGTDNAEAFKQYGEDLQAVSFLMGNLPGLESTPGSGSIEISQLPGIAARDYDEKNLSEKDAKRPVKVSDFKLASTKQMEDPNTPGPDSYNCGLVLLGEGEGVNANVKWDSGHGNAFKMLAGGDDLVTKADIEKMQARFGDQNDKEAQAFLKELNHSTGGHGMELLDTLKNNVDKISLAGDTNVSTDLDKAPEKDANGNAGISRDDIHSFNG